MNTQDKCHFIVLPIVIMMRKSKGQYLENQRDLSECQQLVNDCCHFTSNIEEDSYSSDGDEDGDYEEKEIMHHFHPWDVLYHEKIQGMQRRILHPRVRSDDDAQIHNQGDEVELG